MGKTTETPEIIYGNGRTWAPHFKISIFAIVLNSILLPIYWIAKSCSFVANVANVAKKMFKPFKATEQKKHVFSEDL